MSARAKGINVDAKPSGAGCVECIGSGGWWFHLRRCAECGHIGCCDNSPSQHATRHARETGHDIITSFEPGEEWFYSYESDQMFDGPRMAEPRSHPEDQLVPGPAGKVPPHWQSMLK